MIIAGIFFDSSKQEEIVAKLLLLPEPIKPVIYSADEEKRPKGNLVSNEKKFNEFRKKNRIGFFLHSTNSIFNLSFPIAGKSSVFIELTDESSFHFLQSFLEIFAELSIDFGFAADNAEYEHRNLHFTVQGVNKIKTWVGRDLSKYIPGIYWLTFISTAIAKRYDLDLGKINQLSSWSKGDSNGVLMRFFDEPQSWQTHARLLDEQCSTLEGVFSIKNVEQSISNDMNFIELNTALAQWR